MAKRNNGRNAGGVPAPAAVRMLVPPGGGGGAAEEVQALKDALDGVIDEYNSNRVPLLTLALNNGGVQALTDLEDEYNAVVDARFEINRAELDANLPGFQDLNDKAVATAEAIKKSIKTLHDVKQVIDDLTALVTIIGRILILFA